MEKLTNDQKIELMQLATKNAVLMEGIKNYYNTMVTLIEGDKPKKTNVGST